MRPLALGVAAAAALAAAPAAHAGPLAGCHPLVAVNGGDSTCGASATVAGRTVAADCRATDRPRTPGTYATVNGCAASVAGNVVYVDRCDTHGDSGSPGATSATACRTGVNQGVYECDRTSFGDPTDYGSQVGGTDSCALKAGIASGAVGYSCTVSRASGQQFVADDSSCATRVGLPADGVTYTCAEHGYSTGADYEHSQACVTEVHAGGRTVATCTSDPVSAPLPVDPDQLSLPDPTGWDPTATSCSP